MREQLKLFTREIVDFTFLILSGFDYYQTLLISSNSSKKRPKDSSLLSEKKKKKKKDVLSYLSYLKDLPFVPFLFWQPGYSQREKNPRQHSLFIMTITKPGMISMADMNYVVSKNRSLNRPAERGGNR
nr:AEL_HP1_G0045260.mRNA.1.CDS.1 [Saccharomyces cerevisiae]